MNSFELALLVFFLANIAVSLVTVFLLWFGEDQ